MEFTSKDVLFIGVGRTHIAWYRCFLPARTLDCDWIGVLGTPPKLYLLTGMTFSLPDFDKYAVIVIQQPRGKEWMHWIRERQRKGVKVIYEIDDDLHAAAKLAGHHHAKKLKKHLSGYELCMRIADALIVSTDALAKRYAKYNPNIYVCEAGIDFERYQLDRPLRDKPNIGWSGGTGHEQSLLSWLPAIKESVDNNYTNFISIGVPYASEVGGIAIPATSIEIYPGALANFDIALAPSLHNNFFKAKSFLRWIEASALGIPVIADPFLYSRIEHLVTGVLVSTVEDVSVALDYLALNDSVREEIGEQARLHIKDNYHINQKVEAWVDALERTVE